MYPIIIFVYNKPDTTLKTLLALQDNEGAEQTDVHIFSDGPKVNSSGIDSTGNVQKVREVIKGSYRFKSVTVYESPANKGLAKSVIGGVSQILKDSEAAIIVEDDVLTSRHFIRFMNTQLEHYLNDQKVYSIGSWNYFYQSPTKSNFFLQVPDSIAWGVYARSWSLFRENSVDLASEIRTKNLIADFNVSGAYDFFGMLNMQSEGKVDSWAIRWYATCFLDNALCLYPNLSVSKHIGAGEDAAHCTDPEDEYRQVFDVSKNLPDLNKRPIKPGKAALNGYINFHKPAVGFYQRMRGKISRLIPAFGSRD